MIGRLPGGGESADLQQTPVLSPNEERLERHRACRAMNREHLRDYPRRWRMANPDRLKTHRKNEYERRRNKRRQLRLRRFAQV